MDGGRCVRQQLPSCLFGSRREELVELLSERAPFLVCPGGAIGVKDLCDCEFLFASALGIDYFLLRGGSSDCVLVGVRIRIRPAGVAQLVASKTPSSKSL
jgi:hypothetical protein